MTEKWFGWSGRILEVDLTRRLIKTQALTEGMAHQYLGQAGINARLLYDQTSAAADPFSPAAPLIFGVGPLAGTLAPCSGRFSVTFKSPLTGIFGDSNCGGHWGPELKMAGYDHIVISGKADHPVYLWIDNDRVEIRDARQLWGKTTWDADELIKADVGERTANIACIGPAGENLVRFAAVICNQARAAARCGPGAVMGSKYLKRLPCGETAVLRSPTRRPFRKRSKRRHRRSWRTRFTNPPRHTEPWPSPGWPRTWDFCRPGILTSPLSTGPTS